MPRGLWFRAFLQRATAAERVDLRGSELLPQDVETMWTTAARSDGRRRAMAGQAHRLLLVRPGRPRSCPLLWAAAAWLPAGCHWFVGFPFAKKVARPGPLRDGGVAAIRVGAGTAQIRRVFGEILNINSHGGSGELPISAVALLAVVERGLYCSQSAQILARRAAAP